MTQPHPVTSELLRCDWCGDPCGFDETSRGFLVGCGNVDCHVNPRAFAYTKEEAAEKWNRRTPPSPPAPAMGEWNLDAVMNAVRHYGTTMTNAEILICMGDTLPPLPEKL